VAINTIGAQVLGASSVDVQAVKVYDGVTRITANDGDTGVGALHESTIDADSRAFLGANGVRADALAARLAELWADPERRRAEGEALMARARERHGEEPYIRELLGLYERLR
jgi:glycosyltransferase involved in cell wall biosynthesis